MNRPEQFSSTWLTSTAAAIARAGWEARHSATAPETARMLESLSIASGLGLSCTVDEAGNGIVDLPCMGIADIVDHGSDTADRPLAPWVLMAHSDCAIDHCMSPGLAGVPSGPVPHGEGPQFFGIPTVSGLHLPDARPEGPGIADNSLGIASCLAVMSAMASDLGTAVPRNQISGPRLVITLGEEGEGRLFGARSYLDRFVETPAVVAVEGLGPFLISLEAMWVARMNIRLNGPGGHSSDGISNPAELLVGILDGVVSSSDFKGAAVRVTSINAPGGTNMIPSSAIACVEVRAASERAFERACYSILDRLTEVFEPREVNLVGRIAAMVFGPGASRPVRGKAFPTVFREMEFSRPAREPRNLTLWNARWCGIEASLVLTDLRIGGGRMTDNLRIADPFAKAMGNASKIVGTRVISSDANAAVEKNIPFVTIGLADGGNRHAMTEWFDPESASAATVSLFQGVKQLTLILNSDFGLSSARTWRR